MSKREYPAIIVMGVSGSGKTTVGAGLAERLNCPYLEGDDFHLPESIEKMAAGIALGDDDRWPWLQGLAAGIDASLKQHGGVVATCSALKRKYRDRLRQQIGTPVVFIHLVAEKTNLEQRLFARDAHYMPASLLQSQLQSLEPLGSDEHALVLGNDTTIASVVQAAFDWVLRLDASGEKHSR
jgi:gluconokinase